MSAGVSIAWQQTGDRRTWVTAVADAVMTVCQLSNGQWTATVAGPFIDERSPEFGTRVAARKWAERTAEVTR